jgi:hypothetical protein
MDVRSIHNDEDYLAARKELESLMNAEFGTQREIG